MTIPPLKRIFIYLCVILLFVLVGCGGKSRIPPPVSNLDVKADINNPIWSRFRGSSDNGGRSLEKGPDNPEVCWKYNMKGRVFSSPAVTSDGAVVVGSHGNRICCINSDGTLRWRFDSPDWFFSSPSVDKNGNIFMGCENGEFYCFDRNGKLIWKFLTDGEIFSSANFSPNQNSVYFGSEDGYLYALGKEDGRLLWKFKARGRIFSSPAVDSEGRIYAGDEKGFLYCIGADGGLLWRFDARSEIFASPVVNSHGRVCIGSDKGLLFLLDKDGGVLWKLNLKSPLISSPGILKNGGIIAGTLNGTVHCISPKGRIIWKRLTGQELRSPMVIDNRENIYFFTYPGKKPSAGAVKKAVKLPLFRLYRLDDEGRALKITAVNGPVNGALAIGREGEAFYGCDDGHLYGLKEIRDR